VASIGETFPSDDRIARFVVAMCIAGNDVQHALDRAFAARKADDPAFGYYVRVTTAHLFEGVAALREWRQVRAVKNYLGRLSAEERKNLTKAGSTEQKIGRGVQEHSRNWTFHYPYPSAGLDYELDLEEALEAVADQEATLVVSGDPHLVRFEFADRVAEQLVFAEHAPLNDPKLMKQLNTALEGAVAFVRFVRALALFGGAGPQLRVTRPARASRASDAGPVESPSRPQAARCCSSLGRRMINVGRSA
jgi:hypothetical protein